MTLPIDDLTASQRRAWHTAVSELEAQTLDMWIEQCHARLAWNATRPIPASLQALPWGADHALQTLSMMTAQPLACLKFLGIRRSMEHGDIEGLLRALRQYRRLHAVGFANYGPDHAPRFKPVLEALSAADVENARRLMPAGMSASSHTRRFAGIMFNLLLSLLQPGSLPLDESLEHGRRWVSGKRSVTEAAWVGALMAIADGDAPALEGALSKLAAKYRVMNWAHNLYSAIGRFTATYIYGLLVVAELHHGPEFVDGLQQPIETVWSMPYVTHMLSVLRSGRPVDPFVVFDGGLASWNDPMQWPAGYLKR